MGSETLPSACYILFDGSSIPFYSTSYEYNKKKRYLVYPFTLRVTGIIICARFYEISETMGARLLRFGVQTLSFLRCASLFQQSATPTIPTQRKFVSVDCHAHSNYKS